MVLEFNKGKLANNSQRLILKSVKESEERLVQEHLIFELFLKNMQKANTDQAKIETIASTMQDIIIKKEAYEAH
ncbi:MAG: hypothetical protein H0U73_12120 [Tatlockia sp.]|nr:hypothetical protein [Tatlockia sp.]